ncbi:ABC transporter substrate-binding protein [Pseudorhizobium endolithicum]|uniref:ABC transporter substrate-binding protein n=1 Tax=Pseudorhizobium endolithicum TaxID=1191678 RepID=A0ABN7JLP4_9HYPH|nr:tripartite tricarboxylate transporter substrate binding protein [Pseudorhizobium endolithicum]CAD6436374.1 tripartite tricarboxylate transporter substrate binding protein [Rhizobium sp. Q54]CAD7037063.1 ABC transporter substrate-binding protein [Pseudorhizobium endolithicum]
MKFAKGIIAALLLSATAMPAWAEYPDRPITLLVAWGAGGGTDAVARVVAVGLEKELGQSVNVVNRTGGSGVVGHSAMADAEPDGYTLGLATTEVNLMHWLGLTELDYNVYTPLALMNQDPAGVQVSADSEYQNLGELLEAIKTSQPGTFRATGSGQGSSWHVAIAGLLNAEGIEASKVTWVPSDGAASGLQELLSGGTEIVPSSLVEARALIEAGRVKSLAYMSKERSKLFPDVPTLKEETGSDWEFGAWRGIVAPKGLPDDIRDKLIAALEKVYNSEDYNKFLSAQGFGANFLPGEEFGKFMATNDANFGETMKAIGLAK